MNKKRITNILVLFIISILNANTVSAQNDTLKVFNFESCTVSFIEIDGFKHIVFENDTINTVLFRESSRSGSDLVDFMDVKIGENCSVGLWVDKGISKVYSLLTLQNSKFEVSNMAFFSFDDRNNKGRRKLLAYNIILTESFEGSNGNQIRIYGEDGYIQTFKGEKPFMNSWIANEKNQKE